MNTTKRSTLVVDFDRTIFDSDRLYQDLYSLCEETGIGRNLLDPALALVPPDNLLFNFFLMVRRSQAIDAHQAAIAIKRMESFIQNEGSRYVFDDVRLLLRSAMEDGWKVIILTYGDREFQLAKFTGSKLSGLCHHFLITSEAKWHELEIFNAPLVVFWDDNPKNIDEVKIRFPEVLVVEVKRPNSKYQTVISNKADLVVGRLDWPLRLLE